MARDGELRCTETMQHRSYNREMFTALAVYGGLLLLALPTLEGLEDNPARYVVVLLPMVGFMLGVGAVYRAVRRADEYQRDLLLRTFSICFGLTAAITFGYGFLELVGAPQLSMFAVWPLMGLLWVTVGGAIRLREARGSR